MYMPTGDDISPILVEVKEGRYECSGPPTLRSKMLFEILQGQGGVSDTVPDGLYTFNVLPLDGVPIATLAPRV